MTTPDESSDPTPDAVRSNRRTMLRRLGAFGAGTGAALGTQLAGASPASAAGSDFRARRASERKWRLTNPVLPAGTLAVATDTFVLKVGDGRHRWRSLPGYVPESRIEDVLTRRLDGLRETILQDLADDVAAGPELLDRHFVQIANRPVNLRDRMPAGHAADDPADDWVARAVAESGTVEWPGDLALTFTDPAGINVPEGVTLRADAGAIATIRHTGPGVRVAGSLHGLTVVRTSAATLHDVGVLVLPASVRPRVSSVSVEGGTACFAVGGYEGVPGTSADALLVDCSGRTDAPSSFVFRIDESENVELTHCRGLGSQLDSIKLRRRSRQVRVIGGQFTGARAGDGLDGFGGAEQVYIGGGAIFHGNGHNGLVVKTDDLAGMSPRDQAATFGTPQRLVIDGVMAIGNGGSGIALHRSDAADSDVSAGAAIPWLRGVSLAHVVSADNAGFGVFLNLRAAHVSGVIASRNHQDGVRVHARARDVTLTGVHALGNGSAGQSWDGFHLAGQRIWLTQCLASGVDVDAVADDDLAAAVKASRYGFRIPSGALVHLAQCGAYHNATAPISDSDGRSVLIDCDLGSAPTGVQLGPGGAVGARDGAAFRQLLKLTAGGGSPAVQVGDTTVADLLLAARAGGTVTVGAPLRPQTGGHGLGLPTSRWKDLWLDGPVNLGGGPTISSGTGTPEQVVTAAPGSLYCRSDGVPGAALYVKTTDTGTTGWIAIA